MPLNEAMETDNAELLRMTLARIERGDDPFSDVQGRAALNCLRKFMLQNMPEGFAGGLDEEAIKLVVESEEKISSAIERLAKEAHALFGAIGMKEPTQFAFSLTFAQIVRERIAELQSKGVGRA